MNSEAKGETHGSTLGSVFARLGKRVCSYFKPSEEPAKKPRVDEQGDGGGCTNESLERVETVSPFPEPQQGEENDDRECEESDDGESDDGESDEKSDEGKSVVLDEVNTIDVEEKSVDGDEEESVDGESDEKIDKEKSVDDAEEEGADDDEEEDAAPDIFKELRAVSDCDSESEHGVFDEEDYSSDDGGGDTDDLCDATEEEKILVRSLEVQKKEILTRKPLAIPEEIKGVREQVGDRMRAFIVSSPYIFKPQTNVKVALVEIGMRVIGFRNVEPADQCGDTKALEFFIMLGPKGFRYPVHAYAQRYDAYELYDLVDAVKNNKDDHLSQKDLDILLGLPNFFIPTRDMCKEFVRDPSHAGLDETCKVWESVGGCSVMTPNTAIEEFLRSNNKKHSERALEFASGLKGFMKANYTDYKENTDSILSVLNELCEVQTEISLALKRSNQTKKAVKWNLANRLPGKYEALRLV